MSEHECSPPDLSTWEDPDEDWKCPTCEQDWFVGYENLCHCCYRSDGRTWERYGTGDGSFPLVQARRGGITFGDRT